MSFEVKFSTDNDAFTDGQGSYEISRILGEIAERVREGNVGNFRTILDANGNDIGRWKLELTDEHGHKVVHYANDIPKTWRKVTRQTPRTISKRELATVLVALRYWQAREDDVSLSAMPQFAECEPLTDSQIDELCERLNFGLVR